MVSISTAKWKDALKDICQWQSLSVFQEYWQICTIYGEYNEGDTVNTNTYLPRGIRLDRIGPLMLPKSLADFVACAVLAEK